MGIHDTAEALRRILAADAVRRTAATYFAACDVPPGADPARLGDLFEPDATWQGIGGAFATAFGRIEGREAIVTMLGTHLDRFRGNAHVLGEGVVDVDLDPAGDGTAHGEWVMQQTTVLADADLPGEARVARIRADFRVTAAADGHGVPTATFTRFTTERLVSLALPAGAGHDTPNRALHDTSYDTLEGTR